VNGSTATCFNGTWHTLPEDHTPNDAGGYFMLVNASFIPGDFLVDTVSGLCTHTTYEFAAWVANVLKPGGFCGNGIDPNLTFSIEIKQGPCWLNSTAEIFQNPAAPPGNSTGLF
jgi:hypothetical protein